MATLPQWIEGARPRTLPAAASPVILGSAAAHHLGGFDPLRALLALAVALALQIGVNYSNDYSDGIRGTDAERKGPLRLTGSGLAAPKSVLGAALGFYALAGLAGLALLALSGQWLLLIPGILAVLAGWFYTGGRTPYGYMGIGLSELFVFVFFGLMACVGTTWTQIQEAPAWLWGLASALGLESVALLMVNNIRDIPSDTESGKRTLAVRLGDGASRSVFSACFTIAVVILGTALHALGFTVFTSVCLMLLTALGAAPAVLPVSTGAAGAALIPALRNTGLFTLAYAVLASILLLIA